MNILEIIIYLLTILIIGVVLLKNPINKKYISVLFGTLVILFVLHIIVNNTRWQLYPLYLVIMALVVLIVLKTIGKLALKTFLRRSILTVLIFLIVITGLSTIVFPIYEVPSPNGEFLIGTESFIIDDGLREELYTDDSTDYRKIKIQIWYPAETVEGYDQVPWLEDGIEISRALAKDMGLPYFVLDQTIDIMSNSYLGAPISTEHNDYPIIVISHGWRGFRNLHTDYAEELASLGYIVVGIDHTYGSVATVFDDNDIAYLNLDALPERETTTDFINYANQLVNTYASDVTSTLNYLEEINNLTSSRFHNKLDITKIGLLGHSTGGGGDVAVAINDDRIDAVIGLDAWVEPIDDTEIQKGLSMPSMFIRSGAWETGFNNTNLYSLIENSTYQPLFYQIDGTTHYDFAMVNMYSPFTKYIGFTGTVEGEYLNSILKNMITDFFDEFVKEDSNSQINPDQWEEVRTITP